MYPLTLKYIHKILTYSSKKRLFVMDVEFLDEGLNTEVLRLFILITFLQVFMPLRAW